MNKLGWPGWVGTKGGGAGGALGGFALGLRIVIPMPEAAAKNLKIYL
jgi:hypothetical protein